MGGCTVSKETLELEEVHSERQSSIHYFRQLSRIQSPFTQIDKVDKIELHDNGYRFFNLNDFNEEAGTNSDTIRFQIENYNVKQEKKEILFIPSQNKVDGLKGLSKFILILDIVYRGKFLSNIYKDSNLIDISKSMNPMSNRAEFEQNEWGYPSIAKVIDSNKLNGFDRVLYRSFKTESNQYIDEEFTLNADKFILKDQIQNNKDSIDYQFETIRISNLPFTSVYAQSRPLGGIKIVSSQLRNEAFEILIQILSKHRNCVERIFNKSELDKKNCCYSVDLFVEMEWKQIVIDDILPSRQYRPIVTIAINGEAWPTLLEKALAKVFGSYFNLQSQSSLEKLLKMTTGSMFRKYFTRNLNYIPTTFEILMSNIENSNIVLAHSNPKSELLKPSTQ